MAGAVAVSGLFTEVVVIGDRRRGGLTRFTALERMMLVGYIYNDFSGYRNLENNKY